MTSDTDIDCDLDKSNRAIMISFDYVMKTLPVTQIQQRERNSSEIE